MKIAIVKYNAGNVESVKNALNRLGIDPILADDAETLKNADKVIFPGVGEASTAMDYLKERGLDQLIRELRQPVLGICLGMQLMCSYSEENDTDCLGIFNEKVRKFEGGVLSGDGLVAGGGRKDAAGGVLGGDSAMGRLGADAGAATARLKVPQIGWNNIYDLKTDLFTGVAENSYCYFVHGYYAALGPHTIGKTDYGHPYSSALQKDNFSGVQFHPEKSAGIGEQILKNFVK